MGTRVVRCEEGSVGLHVLPRGVGEGRGRVGRGKENIIKCTASPSSCTLYRELFGDSIVVWTPRVLRGGVKIIERSPCNI